MTTYRHSLGHTAEVNTKQGDKNLIVKRIVWRTE